MLDNAVAFAFDRDPVAPAACDRHLFSAVLDCFDTGVALLGDAGNVVHTNGAMRALAALGVFRLDGGLLTFADRAASETFGELLTTAPAPAGQAGGAFVARDPAHNHALVVRVIAACRTASGADGSGGAIVLAASPSRRTFGDRRLFQIALGLSNAEAAVAVALLEGLGAKEVALRLHVSHETIRTHLKRIFEKTSTRRQAELMLVLVEVARVGPLGSAHPSG